MGLGLQPALTMALQLGTRLNYLQCGWALRVARKRHQAALRAIGAQLPPAVGVDAEASAALAAVDTHQQTLQGARNAVPASLQADRHAYAEVDGWLRSAVIVRGLFDRVLLRARVRRLQKGLVPLQERAANLALQQRLRAPGHAALALVPGAVMEASDAQREVETLQADREKLIAELGGAAWPPSVAAVGRELALFVKTLVREVRSKLVPSFSGLAGLGAGYWIAHTYTDSHVTAVFSRLGLHDGGRHVVSSQQYERLNFWGPLVAAALASYISSRIQALVRARYALRDEPMEQATVQVAALEPSELAARERSR